MWTQQTTAVANGTPTGHPRLQSHCSHHRFRHVPLLSRPRWRSQAAQSALVPGGLQLGPRETTDNCSLPAHIPHCAPHHTGLTWPPTARWQATPGDRHRSETHPCGAVGGERVWVERSKWRVKGKCESKTLTQNASSSINVSMILFILRVECTPPAAQRKKESIDHIVNFAAGQKPLDEPRFHCFPEPRHPAPTPKSQTSVFEKFCF